MIINRRLIPDIINRILQFFAIELESGFYLMCENDKIIAKE